MDVLSNLFECSVLDRLRDKEPNQFPMIRRFVLTGVDEESVVSHYWFEYRWLPVLCESHASQTFPLHQFE